MDRRADSRVGSAGLLDLPSSDSIPRLSIAAMFGDSSPNLRNALYPGSARRFYWIH
jgi:hypothetical protein